MSPSICLFRCFWFFFLITQVIENSLYFVIFNNKARSVGYLTLKLTSLNFYSHIPKEYIEISFHYTKVTYLVNAQKSSFNFNAFVTIPAPSSRWNWIMYVEEQNYSFDVVRKNDFNRIQFYLWNYIFFNYSLFFLAIPRGNSRAAGRTLITCGTIFAFTTKNKSN